MGRAMRFQQQVELDGPFRVDAQGGIATTRDPSQVLRNHVLTVIGTSVGERVMRPNYGTEVRDMLFEGDDDVTSAILQSDIQRALEAAEPGIVVQDVSTQTGNGLDGIIGIEVTYSAANSQLETVTVPVNTAVLYRGGVVEEERSG